MLQYVLTGLAGVFLGVVALRAWQGRDPGTDMPVAPQAGDAAAVPTEPARTPTAPASRNLLIGAGMLALAGAALLVFRSGGSESDASALASPIPGASADTKLDDVDTMIARLEERLKSNPKDGEGFRMLGWSYVMTGHPDKALEPYRKALALLPGNPTVHAGFGEALVGVAGGKVTPEAKAEFDKALSLDPKEPRAVYFTGLWLAQSGRKKEALDMWIALANSGSGDAPWQGEVQGKIAETAKEMGIDVSARIKVKAAPAAAPAPGPAMAGGQAPPSVDAMVEGLAAKLAADPKNPDGWVMLLRSRMVQNQPDKAKADLATARKALIDDPQGLAKVNEAAKAVGVPGA